MNAFWKGIGILPAAALLVACGGGGGGADDVQPNTVSFPVEAVIVGVLTNGASFNAVAVDGPDTWTLSLNAVPAVDQSFEGVSAKKANQSVTIKKNDVTVVSSSGDAFFGVNPYAPKGLILADGSYGVQTVAAAPYPSTAAVGASGSLGKTTIYEDDSKAAIRFTQEGTWTLEADAATTAFFCTNTTAKDVLGQAFATTAGCYKINSAGSVLGIRWTLAVEGKTLTFK